MSGGSASIGLTAFVAHARDVSSEERERFADAASVLAGDRRAILVHTCHRVELYVAHDPRGLPFDENTRLPVPDLPPGGRVLHDADAARHLFDVAAGLDSVVVGEDQVLHQLRDCLASRHLAALESSSAHCVEGRRAHLVPEQPDELAPVLDRLFQLALHVGRETRSWREGPPRSLADVAVDRLADHGPIARRPVLVVGAGHMSRLAAHAARRRGAEVMVSNRTPERAAKLAAEVGGTAVPFGDVPGAVGIVVAIGGEWSLGEAASRALIDGAMSVVDLSSPPALAGKVREALGARFVSVDDVARGSGGAMSPRLRHRIERLLDEAVAELLHWAAARDAVPAIQALAESAESRRMAEVERLLRRMPDLPAHERELVDQMSRRLVAGILHAPLNSLREDESGDRAAAARELFAL